MKKEDPTPNFIIAIICFVFLGYEFLYNMPIIENPYMYFLIMTLFGVGGYNAGVGLGKLLKLMKQ
jgi:hypothetical protein